MAVSVTRTPTIYPLVAVDKRSPSAFWHCTINGTGDASGGIIKCIIAWGRTSNDIFSLEDVSLVGDITATDESALFYLLSGLLSTDDNVWTWATSVKLIGSTGATTYGESHAFVKPCKLIWENNQGGWTAEAHKANGATKTLQLNAWGYMWDKAAFIQPGGPVRPGQVY